MHSTTSTVQLKGLRFCVVGMVKHPATEVHGKESLVRVGSPTRYCKQIRAWYNRLHFEQTKSFVSTSEVCNTVFSNRRVRWTCAFLVQAGMRLWLCDKGWTTSSLLPCLAPARRVTVCGVLLHDWRLLGHCHCHAHCSRRAEKEHSQKFAANPNDQ